jgi:alpha-L-fucosidase 2
MVVFSEWRFPLPYVKCRILSLIVASLVFSQLAAADMGPLVLFYNTEAVYAAPTATAATSGEAIPIGNGKLAAMVYGGLATEILQFNEDTVWTGQPHDYSHTGAFNVLQQIRDYVWAGQSINAYNIAGPSFMSVPIRQCQYEPTAELRLTFGTATTTNYRRQLDLTTAIASVNYQAGGVTYNRDCFASYPDKVIVMRLTASQSNRVSFTCALTSPANTVTSNTASGNDVVLHGAVAYVGASGMTNSVQFESRVRILNEGGTVAVVGNTLQVTGANAVTLVLGASSNVVNYHDITADPAALCLATVTNAAAKSYAVLRQNHLNDYQPLFNRVSLDLGTSEKTTQPINARLDTIDADCTYAQNDWSLFTADDLQLVTVNFQMARYLMIAGSRPGSQPLNLQGKWNNKLNPAWESKMTLNINEEMNYWAAEVANLPECHEPLFDMIRDLSETGATVAQRHYNAGGWVVHHNTDLWRGAAPINGVDGIWPTGGAWLSMHLWWHYEYSGDTAFLAQAYPLMKGAAQFFLDTLVQDTRTGSVGYGMFMTNPGYSPEQKNPALGDNGNLVAGVTMDNQLIRSLFTYVIEASKVLNVDADFRAQLEGKRALLPPNQIGGWGQIQEWLEDVDVRPPSPIYAHRHLSHLVDLMPAGNIDPIRTPAMAAAAQEVLDSKGDLTNNTSWSQAWKMCCRTRLLAGDHAYMILNKIFGKSHTDNMTFSRKGAGAETQIDGNFGVLMGTAEMFLQSQQGEVFLLPALPTRMAAGSLSGFRARGGFTVGITWAANKLTTATIYSSNGNTCRVRSAWPVAVTDGAGHVAVHLPGANLYEFATAAGHTYTLTPYTCTTPIASDLDHDCQVNLADFAVLAGGWTGSGGGGTDFSELTQFATGWLTCSRNPASTCW